MLMLMLIIVVVLSLLLFISAVISNVIAYNDNVIGKSLLFTICSLLVCAGLVGFCLGIEKITDSISMGQENQTGVITNFGTDGAFWKTNEGEMSIGFTKNGTGTISKEEESFCVDDKNLFETINNAKDSGKPVKVTLNKFVLTAPWHCKSDKVLINLEYLKD